jgi:hypothetical protein
MAAMRKVASVVCRSLLLFALLTVAGAMLAIV